MSDFKNKVIVITGAGSGIGKASALLFAQKGGSVVLVGRTEKKLQASLSEMVPGDHLVHPCDISDELSVQKLRDAVINKYGKIDVLVNNAGSVVQGLAHEVKPADWRQLFKVDVEGIFYAIHFFGKDLIQSKGNIVNVSSVSGLGGDWGMSAYNAAKGAVTNFTRSLAMDYGQFGVRVNAICPGLTLTDLTEAIKQNSDLMKAFEERIPLKRAGNPEDLAKAIVFVASDEAEYITGVNLPVDGGLTASNGQPKQA